MSGLIGATPPPNITLVHLLPYSPELNAIEKVWQYVRDRDLSVRLFPGTRAIVDPRCDALNSLLAEIGRTRSLMDFERAHGSIHSALGMDGYIQGSTSG